LDNARLVDRLLISGAVDQESLKEISAVNHLEKVELLDAQGRPWEPPPRPRTPMEMKERMHASFAKESTAHGPFRPFMWGRHWPLPGQKQGGSENLPPPLKEKGEKVLGRQSLWRRDWRPSFSRRDRRPCQRRVYSTLPKRDRGSAADRGAGASIGYRLRRAFGPQSKDRRPHEPYASGDRSQR
jgi:hypothetical protein